MFLLSYFAPPTLVFLRESFEGTDSENPEPVRREKFEQHSGQGTFTFYGGFDCQRKATDRHLFLRAMHMVVPWRALMEMVEPCWPKQEGPGRSVKPFLWMLLPYFFETLWHLSHT